MPTLPFLPGVDFLIVLAQMHWDFGCVAGPLRHHRDSTVRIRFRFKLTNAKPPACVVLDLEPRVGVSRTLDEGALACTACSAPPISVAPTVHRPRPRLSSPSSTLESSASMYPALLSCTARRQPYARPAAVCKPIGRCAAAGTYESNVGQCSVFGAVSKMRSPGIENR